VGGVLIAKTAKLFYFHAVGVILFFFGGVVVALLAIYAGQGYLCSHAVSLQIDVCITKKDNRVRCL
jgi:hypothetical protein